jgi:hypothetical protein
MICFLLTGGTSISMVDLKGVYARADIARKQIVIMGDRQIDTGLYIGGQSEIEGETAVFPMPM